MSLILGVNQSFDMSKFVHVFFYMYGKKYRIVGDHWNTSRQRKNTSNWRTRPKLPNKYSVTIPSEFGLENREILYTDLRWR